MFSNFHCVSIFINYIYSCIVCIQRVVHFKKIHTYNAVYPLNLCFYTLTGDLSCLDNYFLLAAVWASLVAQWVESACDAGDPDSIPGLGRSPEEGHGNSLQYSYLENPKDREAWQFVGSYRVGYD